MCSPLILFVFTMAANNVVIPVGQGAGAANPAAGAGGNPAWLAPLPLRQDRIDEYASLDEVTRRKKLSCKLNDKIKDLIVARSRRETLNFPAYSFLLMSGVHVQGLRKSPLDPSVKRSWILTGGVTKTADRTDGSLFIGFLRF